MKALIYHNHLGPAQLYLKPANDKSDPPCASIPGGPFPRASAGAGSRGREIPWEDWCERLSEQWPYHDSWTHEDVPDGMTPHEALAHVRERESDAQMRG